MKKNRTTLKDRFKKGAIPTEADFVDLIDSMLNQEDDSISKLAGDPVKITALGVDEALLNFYRIENNESKLSWQIKQKPGGKVGLEISDSAAGRLFIENGSGNIGINNNLPKARLDIVQEPRSGNHPAPVKGLYVTGGFGPDNDGVEFRHSNGTQGLGFGYNTIYATGSIADQNLGLKPRGVGKVIVTGGLQVTAGAQVSGALQVSGAPIQLDGAQKLVFSDADVSNNLKLQLWTGYGLGINSSTLFYTAGGQHSWRDGANAERMLLSTAPDGGLTVKGTGASMFAGNLGIATAAAPACRLEVNGTVAFNDGSGFAVKSGNMASGSLTIGSITKSFGGGSGWSGSTAGLMLETLENTEIAVHDSGQRLASLLFYEGGAGSRITIGRDMGASWGAIGSVVLNGSVGVGVKTPTARLSVLGPNASELWGTAKSATFLTSSGGLGNNAGNDLALASIGFTSGNASSLGIRALRTVNGGDWNSTAIGLCMDVDNTVSAGASLWLHANGNVGVGTKTQGVRLEVSGNLKVSGDAQLTGVLTGPPNDYFKAQFTMTGGGTVTWAGGRLKWTARFIAISMERATTFGAGYVDIYPPATDIPAAQVYDGAVRSANSAGVVLAGWEALYAVHTVGGDNLAVSLRIVRYTNGFVAPSNWLLVAVVNGDDNTLRLGTGVILCANSASSLSSPIPQGVITMWSGPTNNIPTGWALCDGNNGTPNLKDRFIVGAGASYGVGATGGANTVALSINEMPSHNHNNGNFSQLLQNTGRDTTDGLDNNAGGTGEPDVARSAAMVNTGGGQAHENRPPYYALAFIMKL
ncbi:MAG: hypothetical protein RL748_4117 [Pseudomonadota bacterium]